MICVTQRVVFAALIVCFSFSPAIALEDVNVTDNAEYLPIINNNGEIVFIADELMKKLDKELEIWHWTPWLRTRTEVLNNIVQEVTCPEGDSINSFPAGVLTVEQLRKGAIIVYIMFGIYAFTLLAIVCNDYFIPCVEMICEDLKIPENVAAATFMAVATSCPEFFVNIISTFVTESDMGVGTIVGSAIFNLLGVAAIGSVAALHPIAIEMRPVTRDVCIYIINVSVLVVIVWDGQIEWYEAMILGILYVCYFILMFNSVRLFSLFDKLINKCCKRNGNLEIAENETNDNRKAIEDGIDNSGYNDVDAGNGIPNREKAVVLKKGEDFMEKQSEVVAEHRSIWTFPKQKSLFYKSWWLYSWPLKFLLRITIPSPLTCRKFYPLAFLMCILWIGVNAYFVSWSMSVIGHTFFIPDSVMGMTLLAWGGCIPESCSIFIMSRKGEGGMGVSNALGANSLAILFALGIPWLIRTLTLVAQGAENPVVYINSAGIDFVVGSLLVAVLCLWAILFFGKFKLRLRIGIILFILYIIFITFAILVEMGFILDRGILIC